MSKDEPSFLPTGAESALSVSLVTSIRVRRGGVELYLKGRVDEIKIDYPYAEAWIKLAGLTKSPGD